MAAQLKRRIHLIKFSADRLVQALEVDKHDKPWWRLVRREAWIHLKLTLKLLWMTLRRKEG